MPYWYEVFDNEQIHLATRKQAATLTATLAGVVLATVLGIAIAHAGYISALTIIGILGAVWAFTLRWMYVRLNRLRRVMWCIKISDRRIVGYDYSRRQTVLDWTKVDRVELADTGMILSGQDGHFLEIPHLFPEFSELSHRVVSYAEFYDIPVLVEGRPWQNINVYNVFPFLIDGASSDSPGSLRA